MTLDITERHRNALLALLVASIVGIGAVAAVGVLGPSSATDGHAGVESAPADAPAAEGPEGGAEADPVERFATGDEYRAVVSGSGDPATEGGVTTIQEDDDEGAHFDVEIVGTNAPLDPGPPLEVDVRVENTGDAEDTQRVQFLFEGEERDDLFVERTLEPGENATVGFGWATNTLEPGEYEVGVRSEDDEDTQTVEITEPSVVQLNIVGTNAPVEEGETLEVTVRAERSVEGALNRPVELRFDGEVVDSQTFPLFGEPTETRVLTYETQPGDAGNRTVTAETFDDADSTTVTITAPDEDEGENDEATVYWQVDFGEGEDPPLPPSYWPTDLMAALGNSDDGVTENPSALRQRHDGELGDVTIVDREFEFDDEGDPTEVTVEFELDEDAEERELHLASFVLPGPFDMDEIGQQELFASTNGTYEGGESGELTVSIPQPEDVDSEDSDDPETSEESDNSADSES